MGVDMVAMTRRRGAGRRVRVFCWRALRCMRSSLVSFQFPLLAMYVRFENRVRLCLRAHTEILVDVVDVVMEGSGIDEKFLGVTLFALVPNTTEFMNAISFAMNGNIALRYVEVRATHHRV